MYDKRHHPLYGSGIITLKMYQLFDFLAFEAMRGSYMLDAFTSNIEISETDYLSTFEENKGTLIYYVLQSHYSNITKRRFNTY